MKIVDKFINNIIELIMAASSLVLSVVTLLQVISRFILKNPIAWGQDVVRLSFIYLVFWGGAYCVKEKGHLNIDILLTAVKGKTRYIIEFLINIVLLAFFAFIIYYGFIFTKTGVTQKAPYLDIPMSIYYLSLPTAGILMFYYQIKQIIAQIKDFEDGNFGGDQI
jgi:TRAP-type C4-dicarboxylate transport system permease small subunit